MEEAPWLAAWPGVCLTIVVYSFNMLGDAMRDLLDPRLRGGGGRPRWQRRHVGLRECACVPHPVSRRMNGDLHPWRPPCRHGWHAAPGPRQGRRGLGAVVAVVSAHHRAPQTESAKCTGNSSSHD